MKTLVVIPGLSSPHYPKYKPAYDLLRSEGDRREISLSVVTYPGQVGPDGQAQTRFLPKNAVRHVIERLEALNARAEPFAVLGISYGCNVTLAAAMELGALTYWQKATLWGPLTWSRVWEAFGRSDTNPAMGKGTMLCGARTFLDQVVPNEVMIPKVSVPLVLGAGPLDAYVTPDDLRYLGCLNEPMPAASRTICLVEGCGHTVTQEDPGYQDYLTLVFAQ